MPSYNYGPLDTISSFPFENFMRKLLKSVRKPSMALQQIIRRWYEVEKNCPKKKVIQFKKVTVHKEHHCGQVPQGVAFTGQFKEAHMEHFVIKINSRDNCVSFENEVALVCNILLVNTEVWFVYQSFANTYNFFEYPVGSDFLGIHKVENVAHALNIRPVTDVTSKNVKLPHGHGFVVVPMIHSRH